MFGTFFEDYRKAETVGLYRTYYPLPWGDARLRARNTAVLTAQTAMLALGFNFCGCCSQWYRGTDLHAIPVCFDAVAKPLTIDGQSIVPSLKIKAR